METVYEIRTASKQADLSHITVYDYIGKTYEFSNKEINHHLFKNTMLGTA